MGRNILVVEDDRNISELIHMYLVKEGFDVRDWPRMAARPLRSSRSRCPT